MVKKNLNAYHWAMFMMPVDSWKIIEPTSTRIDARSIWRVSPPMMGRSNSFG